MKKNVWILNHHADDTFFEHGGRHYYFAKYLKLKGYNPTIFCSNSIHGKNDIHYNFNGLYETHHCDEIGVPYVFVKGRPYIGNGKNRILCMLDYYSNMQKLADDYIMKNGKPDVIIGSSVHPLAALLAIKFAKKYNVKSVVEIRDLWPESLVAYGLAKKNNPAVIALRILEKKLYSKSDRLVFTMEGAYDYIIKQGWEHIVSKSKISYINNGVDEEQFYNNLNQYHIEDDDLDNNYIFKAVYAGSIGASDNVELLVRAFGLISNNNIKLLVWGDGDKRKGLEDLVQQEKIENVIFKGRVEKKYVPYITSKADLNIVHFSPTDVVQYGVSPNKLFDYIAAGKPILTTFPCKYNPVVDFGIGFMVDESTPEKNSSMIEEISRLTEEQLDLIRKNSEIAREKYNFVNLTNMLIECIEK